MFDFATQLISLDDRTLLCLSGADAVSFLQGQLTQDMTQLNENNFLWAAHCSPKGRVLFTVLLWSHQGQIFLDAPAHQEAYISQRLRPFILRAKVTLASARSTLSARGLMGQDIEGYAQTLGLGALPEPGQRLIHQDVHYLRLATHQLMLIGPPHGLPPAETQKSQGWSLANLRQGIAEIDTTNQDRFIPQWLNWDLIGGISFKKGCYTGQEIVARTHYLGKVTRRTRRFISSFELPPTTPLLSQGLPVGEVVTCVPNPEGRFDVLAVLQQAAAPPEAAQGQGVLSPATLPYGVPA